MAEVIITIENLRYITRALEAKRTDKIKVSIVGTTLKFEDLKTGERAEIQSIIEKPQMTKRR